MATLHEIVQDNHDAITSSVAASQAETEHQRLKSWAIQKEEEAMNSSGTGTTTNKIPANTYAEETLAGGGKSIINTQFSNRVISGTSYADYIYSWKMAKVTINSGAGDDTVSAAGTWNYYDGTHTVEERAEVYSGDGNDTIYCGDNVLLDSGAGDDTINNPNSGTTIYGGAGNDSVYSLNATITAGTGDDTIKLSGVGGGKNVIQYSNGDGNDVVQNFSSSDTLRIYGSYATQESGDNVIVQVGSGMIILAGAKGQPLNIETSAVAFPTPAGDISASTTTTGTPNFNFGTSTPTATVNTNSTASTNSGSGYSLVDGGTPSFSFPPLTTNYAPRVYAGGDQIISDYTSGEKIMLGTMPTGWIFGGGNFALGSDTGNLFIANANDKLIDFTDAAGNSFLKAYSATNAGTIDGRGLGGYEYIVGSDAGADIIYAGDGGSQLWGGAGLGADALIGGGGTDIFTGGKYQGADVFANASSADVVNLNDATLSDIVAAGESNNVISIAFNTGNVVAVGSSELLSAAFVLADGSAWRYNHVTKSWQGA